MPTRFVVFSLALLAPALRADDLATVAERTQYAATSRYDDVMAFCRALAAKAPNVVRLADLGTSGEGRKLPLVILADPPVSTPDEVPAGKTVVFAMANLHAGEVDGKEALMMLARDIATDPAKPLLKDLVVLLAPIFNADGNEKIDKANRRSQNGPADGVGRRYNAAGLDLNRDFVKLESPEVRALVKLLNQWDPAVVIDCHTTNGSYHRYTLTYDGPRHPNCNPEMLKGVRDAMLPEVGKRMEKATGYKSFYYGNYSDDRAMWETYEAWPRYGVQYFGLRNRVGILSESYTYAPFKDRTLATRAFVRTCFEYAAEKKADIKKWCAVPKDKPALAVRTEPRPLDEPFALLGVVEDEKNGRRVPTDTPKEYSVRYLGRTEPVMGRVTARPAAYLFPASFAKAVECLQRHGIKVEELREDIDLAVEVYRVDKLSKADRAFQKHNLVAVQTAPRTETRRFNAGTILVRTNQPLGTLAGLLLEPTAEDGLTTWNFFDDGLAEGRDFPVARLTTPTPVLSGGVRPLAEDRGAKKRITVAAIDGTGSSPNLSGNATSVEWLDDDHFLQTKDGQQLKVHARTGKSSPLHQPNLLSKSLGSLATFSGGGGGGQRFRRGGGGGGGRTDPKRLGTLVERENDFYYGRYDGTPAVRLTKSPGAKELARFSPDGKFVAFVKAGNLYVTDVATQTERALTSDGGGAIANGKADWVYTEEVFNRNPIAYWWSPDSRAIAFLRFDDTPVHKFAVVDHLPTRLTVEQESYPKAGDPNPKVTLHVVSAAGGDATAVDMSNYSPAASIICRVGWTPDSANVVFYVQNRAQTWLDVCRAPAKGGETKRLLRDQTAAWVEDLGEPHDLPDGSFLLSSERSGWKHLYHFGADGQLIRAVTSGPWECRKLQRVNAGVGVAYVTGTGDGSTGEHLYRVHLDGSGSPERLTPAGGAHAIAMNPSGTLFVDTFSDPATPTKVILRDADGNVVRTLDTNPVYSREEYEFGSYERVKVPLPDGFVLEGSLVKPLGFDPAKKYPVWVKTYGGPHSPTVRDDWGGGHIRDHALASMGLVVFNVDPRSASGQGAVSAWAAYRKLGVPECKDMEAAVDWLTAKHPWADAKRVGLSGHSYGGFLTAFCLTHSTKFAAGIAGAPVTDWRNYDSIYTERYMNTPQENPDGYAASSVVKAAKNLHGRLLLLHGLRDDNVHVQNTVQLVHELQRADKDFEVMIYPTARHGIGGKHYQRLWVEFVRKTMLPEK